MAITTPPRSSSPFPAEITNTTSLLGQGNSGNVARPGGDTHQPAQPRPNNPPRHQSSMQASLIRMLRTPVLNAVDHVEAAATHIAAAAGEIGTAATSVLKAVGLMGPTPRTPEQKARDNLGMMCRTGKHDDAKVKEYIEMADAEQLSKPDYKGAPPAMSAVLKGRTDVLEALTEKGVNLHEKSSLGDVAVEVSASDLIKMGAHIEAKGYHADIANYSAGQLEAKHNELNGLIKDKAFADGSNSGAIKDGSQQSEDYEKDYAAASPEDRIAGAMMQRKVVMDRLAELKSASTENTPPSADKMH